jgi:hypothetical protein
MNRLRSSGRYVIAELKISLTWCQRSGVILKNLENLAKSFASKSKLSANGAEYESQGQARKPSPQASKKK